MLDQMANHAARVNRYIDRFGYEPVEEFIDACLSIEDLIDPHSQFIKRRNPIKPSGMKCRNLNSKKKPPRGGFRRKVI